MVVFGIYNKNIAAIKLHETIELDGNDGFMDQSLWGYEKDVTINFVLNDKTLLKNPFEKDFISGKLLKNTDSTDYAAIVITKIQKLQNVFESQEIKASDQELILDKYKNIWNVLFQRKSNFDKKGLVYKYKELHSELLSIQDFSNIKAGKEVVIKRSNELVIFPKLIGGGDIRVLSIGSNHPESSCIYDLVNGDTYFTRIENFAKNAEWTDEKNWWSSLLAAGQKS